MDELDFGHFERVPTHDSEPALSIDGWESEEGDIDSEPVVVHAIDEPPIQNGHNGASKPATAGAGTAHFVALPTAHQQRRQPVDLHAQCQQVVRQLEQRLAQSHERENELGVRLATAESRLLVVTRDLETSRAFVSREETDAQDLLTLFRDVNEGVDDLTHLLMDDLGDIDYERKLTMNSIRSALETNRNVRHTLLHFFWAGYANHMEVGEFLDAFVQSYFNALLEFFIFRPFVPGADDATNTHLTTFYAHICAHEPQDRSARWRAMTYSHCAPMRDDEKLLSGITDFFFRGLEDVVPHLAPDAADAVKKLRAARTTTARRVVADALKFQDRAHKDYLSFDYSIFAPKSNTPAGGAATAAELKRCPHAGRQTEKEQGKVAFATMAFGLKAERGVQKHEGGIERQMKVMTKPKVILAKCEWIPSHRH